jgi:hypothetical protein
VHGSSYPVTERVRGKREMIMLQLSISVFTKWSYYLNQYLVGDLKLRQEVV